MVCAAERVVDIFVVRSALGVWVCVCVFFYLKVLNMMQLGGGFFRFFSLWFILTKRFMTTNSKKLVKFKGGGD